MNDTFVNVFNRAAIFPTTFIVPSSDELRNLEIGDCVKLISNNERFWVVITQISKDKVNFMGKVDNELINEHPFTLGSVVSFCAYNIMDIEKHVS